MSGLELLELLSNRMNVHDCDIFFLNKLITASSSLFTIQSLNTLSTEEDVLSGFGAVVVCARKESKFLTAFVRPFFEERVEVGEEREKEKITVLCRW